MIAIERFKKFKVIDLAIILFIALIWSGIGYFVNIFLTPQSSYVISLLIATFLMSLTVHLVRKAGSAILFYVMGGFLMFGLNDLGITHMNKIWILLIAGLVFELVFVIFKLELKNIQLDIVLGTGFSAASIPITTAFLLSTNLARSMIVPIFNLSLLSFIVGIVGAIASFFLWYRLRTNRAVLRYEYMP